MAAGARIAPRIPAAGAHLRPPARPTSRRPVAAAAKCCGGGGFLPWVRSKAGADISSVLRVGTSPLGRSLFASHPIRKGDCIMRVPRSAQLTQDKLPQQLRVLLDDDGGVAGDTTKVAVLLMMEQRLGHVGLIMESGWAPYVRSLPCKDQMHNVALERFPPLFGEIKLEDFMHASALGLEG